MPVAGPRALPGGGAPFPEALLAHAGRDHIRPLPERWPDWRSTLRRVTLTPAAPTQLLRRRRSMSRRASPGAIAAAAAFSRVGASCPRPVAIARVAVPGTRFEQLSPGVDSTVFTPHVDGAAVRERYGFGTAPVVVCVSRLVKRKGQESFNFGELFAFTKVCSHLGCPSSLYEQQTYRILCPCHQSQFDITDNARPIFGPATRRLPMLPLDVENGVFVAKSDFRVPIGPAFWERP